MSTNSLQYFNNSHLEPDLRGHAIRGAGITILGRVVGFIVQMIGSIILARLLSPNDFGVVAMVTAFSMVLMDVGMLGLNEAIIQAKKITHDQISTLFWLSLSTSLIMGALFACTSPMLAAFYKEPQVKGIAIAISFGFVFRGAATQHLGLLRRNLEFIKVVISETCSMILGTVLAIILAFYGFGYWALVARRLGTFFISAIGAWIFCKWRPGLPRIASGVSDLTKFGLRNLGSQMIGYLTKNVDKILLGWRFGGYTLGSYDRAYHLFVMPFNQITSPISSVTVATLSKVREKRNRYHRYYLKLVAALAFIGMGISGLSALLGKDLITGLLGPQWGDAGKIFRILGVGIGPMLLYSTSGWVHISIGRADRLLRWSTIGSITTCAFILIGLFFGPLGVACGFTASFLVLIGPALQYAGKPIGLKGVSVLLVTWKYCVASLLSGVVCGTILYHFDPVSSVFSHFSVYARIIVGAGMFLVGYLLIITVLLNGMNEVRGQIALLLEMVPDELMGRYGNQKLRSFIIGGD